MRLLPRLRRLALATLLFTAPFARLRSAETPGDRMMAREFAAETARIGAEAFAGITTREDWIARRTTYVAELQEMLGLSPLPEKTDLHATITGREEREECIIEKVHYQSLPGLYATGTVYLPRRMSGKVPAILYVCGHANVKEGGISYGAKANYQHHGAWFARHGYVCLMIDTIQLGELEGIHHGTYREGMWWWNSRGYTPAGVEAWNSIRALDYLQSRPEVNPDKLGMTGRSGGGAYTWTTAALDERIKVAVPVAGITDLHNYVVDGCVTGHCDCMFFVNTYRWDTTRLAALVAPRPLLLGNSDKDRIFPLDGVLRVHRALTSIYGLYGASDKLGLLITEGPHQDTQDLQVPALRWFDRFLKGEQPLVKDAAEKLFRPSELKVFATLPTDQRTTRIHETFVPAATPSLPSDAANWSRQRDAWLAALRGKSFGGWPKSADALELQQVRDTTRGTLRTSRWEFTSQGAVRLPLVVVGTTDGARERPVYLHVADETEWAALTAAVTPERAEPPRAADARPLPPHLAALQARAARGEVTLVLAAPRGVGPTAFGGTPKDIAQIRRRFMLLGQTLDGMRVWDIQRAVAAVRATDFGRNAPVHLSGSRTQAANALYASLFTPAVASVTLIAPPVSHVDGPDYLNVLRFLDLPQTAALAAERQPVRWVEASPEAWNWTTQTARVLGWPADRLQWTAR